MNPDFLEPNYKRDRNEKIEKCKENEHGFHFFTKEGICKYCFKKNKEYFKDKKVLVAHSS